MTSKPVTRRSQKATDLDSTNTTDTKAALTQDLSVEYQPHGKIKRYTYRYVTTDALTTITITFSKMTYRVLQVAEAHLV